MKRPGGIPDVAWYDVERAIASRDAEHRADFDALAKEFAKANGAIDGQLMEIERLKGELTEANKLLADYRDPPAHGKHQVDCTLDTDCFCECQSPVQQASPNDIRERLERLEEWASMRERGPFRLAALEAKGEPGTHAKGAKP